MSHLPAGPVVALIGATGFLGRSCFEALAAGGRTVRPVVSPRLASGARDRDGLVAELGRTTHQRTVDGLAVALRGAAAVVNTAGLARPDSPMSDELIGANGLLPGVVVKAAGRADVPLVVHLSSTAVQGDRPTLDETDDYRPLTPYARSKVLGEELALGAGHREVRVFRPTSVHGEERRVTRALHRFASSPMSSVARGGHRSTPQVLVRQVGEAVAVLVGAAAAPPITLQPDEGMSTDRLLLLLGGRDPRRVPERLARVLVGTAALGLRVAGRPTSAARRLELVWFGQAQARSSLVDLGYVVQDADQDWIELGRACRLRPARDTADR